MPGIILVVFVCLGAALLSIPAASWTGLATWGSLAASSTAFTAMSLNQVLAMRLRLVESLFGGLDKIYAAHRMLGIGAALLILVHYLVTPNFKGIDLTDDLNDLAKSAGQIAFYALMFLVVLSLLKRVPFTRWRPPYQWWRRSHRLMGVAFCLVAFHQFFIKRPFDGDAALVGYLTFFALIGIAGFFCTELLPLLRRRRYRISRVERLASATVIEARPAGRPIRLRPGQFAFLSIARAGLREPHPFTVAGRDADGTVRFAIKASGDFTEALRRDISINDVVRIEGGYGRFDYARGGDTQVWLAGGIGITPFLAMTEALEMGERRRIHLVHCVRDRREALGLELIRNKMKALASFTYEIHESSTGGRLDAAALRRITPFELAQTDLWFCGPPVLRTSLVAGLAGAGVRFRRVEYERFEFR